ncbi:asparaginase [Microbacterium sp. SLBN-146]|uniref:asparaginase n=1 Tax=Microbacterium sp. SLBN-146 TaxID=2768457 RepID=UPI00116FDB0E|nr:asparaginase [Microbacterium sp. SLBN-146]TQJ30734.1 asparaginase [Microbacterium sp. SLBN-146]
MKVGLLATGGTIASRHDDRGALVPVLRGEALLGGIRLHPALEVQVVDLEPVASYATTLTAMVDVVLHVRALLETGCEGVVVTHGTDTLEEMAFLTSMLLPLDARVALTGAQRPAGEADTDALRNLADAFAAVREGLPVSVVIGGLAIAGAEARKTHSSAIDAFSGGAAGAIALIDDDEVIRLSRPYRGAVFAGVDRPIVPRVDIVKSGAGTNADHIDASVRGGAAGIVLEAMGRGNTSPSVTAAVERAVRAGVVVLITSRTGAGLVRPAYGVGGGADLRDAGALFAGDLTTSRARVALSLAIGQSDAESVEELVTRTWKVVPDAC